MNVIKIIGIVIACMIAIPLVAALFVPKSYTVSVTEAIDKPKQEVYDYVRILDNQKKYSVWVMADPSLNPTIVGTDGTVGAIQKWNSKNDKVGEGEQEITGLDGSRMDVDLRFKRPFEGKAKGAYIFKPLPKNKTELTAEFYSNEKYPMNLPSYLFGRKMIEEAQTKNLQNLKKLLEQ